MFSATMEAAAHQETEALAGYLAAAFVRSATLTPFLAKERVDLTSLLNALNSAPPGQSTFDAFQRITPDTRSPDRSEPAEELLDALPRGGFTGVRMPANVVAFFELLERDLGNAPKESVQPSVLLLSLLKSDPQVRNTFEQHGIHLEALRAFVRPAAV